MKKKHVILLAISLSIVAFIGMNAPYFIRYVQYAFAPQPDAIVLEKQERVSKIPCDPPDNLSIPRLGIEAPVRYASSTSESVFQDILRTGVVHYPGTAEPGQLGNVYIFGHSSDFVWSRGTYKSIFAPLPNIQKGDGIRLTDHQGRAFLYRVTGMQVVSPSETWVLDQGEYKQKRLTLQTSYPIGTAWKRFVAFAELQDVGELCETEATSTKR